MPPRLAPRKWPRYLRSSWLSMSSAPIETPSRPRESGNGWPQHASRVFLGSEHVSSGRTDAAKVPLSSAARRDRFGNRFRAVSGVRNRSTTVRREIPGGRTPATKGCASPRRVHRVTSSPSGEVRGRELVDDRLGIPFQSCSKHVISGQAANGRRQFSRAGHRSSLGTAPLFPCVAVSTSAPRRRSRPEESPALRHRPHHLRARRRQVHLRFLRLVPFIQTDIGVINFGGGVVKPVTAFDAELGWAPTTGHAAGRSAAYCSHSSRPRSCSGR